MSKNVEKNWFEAWFASPYYHLLYQNRDEQEAYNFIEKLTTHLKMPNGAKVHDLACGAGRHSISLNQLGYNVHGSDLSAPSIETAKQSEKDGLSFEVLDMRETHGKNQFDYVLNLFTSFGYFEDLNDNLKTLKSIYNSLTENGLLVIDFMNADKVIKHLVQQETKTIESTTFEIKRFVENGIIHKNIQFDVDGEHFEYEEKVQGILKSDFIDLLEKANFKLMFTFGSYNLDDFNIESSDRLILVAQKEVC